ncbi:MAG: hypothetical protein AABX89_06670 [Candidatus Thermoplasmatota archaeon]
MRGVALLVVAFVTLSGCAGSSEEASGSTGPDGTPVATDAGIAAPTWELGDSWNFTGPFGSFDYVVSAVGASDYTIDTTARGLAWFNTRSDISTMGDIRISDLAGSQGSTRVQFFDWPLRDNKTWSLTIDEGQGGGTLDVTAKRTGPETFAMTARFDNGTAYMSYIYDNRTKWFSELDFKDPQGNSGFKITLARKGTAFAGDLVRWEFDTIVEDTGDLASIPGAGTSFYNVPLTATDVYVDVELHCTAGFAGAGTAPAPFVGSLAGTDDRGAGDPGAPCPLDVSFHGVAGESRSLPNGMGELWGHDLVGGPGTTGTYALAIYVRTATLFKVGEAPA